MGAVYQLAAAQSRGTRTDALPCDTTFSAQLPSTCCIVQCSHVSRRCMLLTKSVSAVCHPASHAGYLETTSSYELRLLGSILSQWSRHCHFGGASMQSS